jgi:succinate-semialdehyde dehydrogenase/glutarate-semialdehyde dehydrogenase
MSIITINPTNEQVIMTYETMTSEYVKQTIESCYADATLWSNETLLQRSKKMIHVADILLANKNHYAALITNEMGKTLTSAMAEIEKCALACRHFATHAEIYLTDRSIKTDLSKSYVTYRPLGIIFAIMPWNFPFWQVFRVAAPALMAGNGFILKHAPNTTGCGLEIEKIFRTAGFPANIFRTVIIDTDQAPDIIKNLNIHAVTLTGSDRTGKKVGALALDSLKKIGLELGGSDPYIVLEDADLELAANCIIASRLNNSGQSCIAAKRLLVVSPVRAAFEELLLKKLNEYTVGDPTNESVQLGPLARADLLDHLHQQIKTSVKQGAKIIKGGFIPEQLGFYYPITVLTHVKKGMVAYEEELFGPVITFIDVRNEADAIEIANDTKYGLGAAVFTKDTSRGEKIAAEKIKAGTVFVNDFVRSDPRLPFGGIKASGFGRELSEEGIREFVNIKTIGIR